MTLAASFKEHYSRATTATSEDENVDHFNAAMNSETNRREAAMTFNNADGSFFFAQNGELKIIHGLTDMNNTFTRRESKVGGHMGMNEIAFAGRVVVDMALTLTTFDTSTGNELSSCITEAALGGLQPGVPHGTYEGASVFFAALFVQRAVIQKGSSCPIKIIFKVREEYTNHIVGLNPGLVDVINAHVELLEQLCWGYHASRIHNPSVGTTTTTLRAGGGETSKAASQSLPKP